MNAHIRVVVCLVAALAGFCLLRSGRYPNKFSSGKPPCWIRCHKPARVASIQDLLSSLRSNVNPELSLLDRYSGFFTTPIFKMSGIQGWRDYGTPTSVVGEIIHVGHSLDEMTTVDMEVRRVSTKGQVSPLLDHKFLRIEVFGYVGRHLPISLLPAQSIQVNGQLMWDGDGFLEVHPLSATDITVLNHEETDEPQRQ